MTTAEVEITTAVRDIAAMLEANLAVERQWQQTWGPKASRVICEAPGCGCLCLPDEACPACRVRAAERRAQRRALGRAA